MAVTLNPPSSLTGDSVYLTGAGQNVPVANKMRFDIALSASGPWDVYSSPDFVGLNTPNQNIAHQVPAGTLDPETQYFVRLVELDAADAIVATSAAVSFGTTSSGDIAIICIPPCAANAAIPFPWVLPPCAPACPPVP